MKTYRYRLHCARVARQTRESLELAHSHANTMARHAGAALPDDPDAAPPAEYFRRAQAAEAARLRIDAYQRADSVARDVAYWQEVAP